MQDQVASRFINAFLTFSLKEYFKAFIDMSSEIIKFLNPILFLIYLIPFLECVMQFSIYLKPQKLYALSLQIVIFYF